jgi:hypothetical protein
MAKIYRYEMEIKGIKPNPGPYTAHLNIDDEVNYLLNELSNKHVAETHPGLRVDFSKHFAFGEHITDFYCACNTLDSLKRWFKGFNTKLLSLGFKLVEYEVSAVYDSISGYQCFFKQSDIISRNILK